MTYSTEQVMRGLINYADNEVMNKLPTTSKWVVGTVIGIASRKSTQVINSLKTNPIISTLGVIDNDGNIEVDEILSAMKDSMDRYGNISVEVAMLGRMTFTSNDLDRLRDYIQ